jgi:hypothetical protein
MQNKQAPRPACNCRAVFVLWAVLPVPAQSLTMFDEYTDDDVSMVMMLQSMMMDLL